MSHGRSTIRYFPSTEYKGNDQLQMMMQDSRGLLVVLDGYRLLQFDGVDWRPFRLPFYTQSSQIDDQDRFYIGGPRNFGYLDLVEDSVHYTSVREMLPEEKKTPIFLGFLKTARGIVFCTQGGLYLLTDDQQIEILLQDDSAPFRQAFVWQEKLYVDHTELGLLTLDDRSPARALETEQPISSPVALLPWEKDSALLFTQFQGSFRLSGDRLEAFPLPADAFLRGKQINYVLRASDGRIIIGTERSGILVLSPHGELVEVLNRESHWQVNHPIHHIFEDRQGNLWFSTDSGIVQIPRSSTRKIIDPSEVEGALHRTYRHRGRLYFATRTHLYRQSFPEDLSEQTPPSLPATLEKIPGISGTWVLLSAEEDLLLGTSDGIFVLRDAGGTVQTEKICSPTAVTFDPSRLFPGRIFAATRDGLRIVFQENGRWTCSEPIGSMPRFYQELVEMPDGVILVLAYSREFYRLTFPNGVESPPEEKLYQLPEGNNSLLVIDGEAFLSNDLQGLLRYQETASLDVFPFQADPEAESRLLPDRLPGQGLALYEEAHDRLWSYQQERLMVAHRDSEDGIFRHRHIAPDQFSYWCDIFYDSELRRYWMTNFKGTYLTDIEGRRLGPSTQTLLRRVQQVSTGMDLLHTSPSTKGMPVLAYQENSLEFEFAAPVFDQLEASEYQWKLEDFDSDWSSWSPKTSKEYTNLRENTYRFRVRARDRWNAISQEAVFSFQVKPPFYRTHWAYLLYFLGFLLILSVSLQVHRKLIDRERAISRRLREVDQLKDEFLANTSHELRTPLFGITGLAEAMLDGSAGELPDAAKENLSMIVSSGLRLTHLVGDILDMSKMQHQSLQLRLRAVDLHSLVDIVLTLSAPLIASKPLRFKNAVPPDLPPVEADENRLQQILYNLLGNAAKFTEEGEIVVSAELVGESPEEEQITVHVRDTGIGIPTEKQQQIFQPFAQADASIERLYGGTGIGLTVTRQLVELHGGKIWVESTMGEGSTFFFSLARSRKPLDRPATGEVISSSTSDAPLVPPPHPDSPEPQIPQLQTEQEVPSSADPSERISILVVDDESVNRQVLKNYLHQENYRLTFASNGSEALRHIREERYDLILLDVMMPKVSGFEVCRVLRETYPMPELPVLFLTAKNQTIDVETGLSLGANDFLSKPISKDELLARIRPHLDLLSAHRRLEHLVEEKTTRINTLEGILPICFNCKKIRDDEGKWTQMETYIDQHSEAEFSHGICPDCNTEFRTSLQIPPKEDES